MLSLNIAQHDNELAGVAMVRLVIDYSKVVNDRDVLHIHNKLLAKPLCRFVNNKCSFMFIEHVIKFNTLSSRDKTDFELPYLSIPT